MKAYEMRISDWSSDVCSSDLVPLEQDSGGRVEVVPSDQCGLARGNVDRVGQVDGRVSPAARDVRDRDENLITAGVVTVHADSEVVRSGCTSEERGRARFRDRVCKYV